MRLSRPKRAVVLSALAELDFADILQYTLENWGVAQMERYAEILEQGMTLLTTNPLLGKRREDWFPGCRCHQIKHHLVLYEVVDGQVHVARLFHERMDAARNLGE
jgi:toxin ParE1/3/4